MRARQRIHRHLPDRQDVQPKQHRPQSVLFADMVRAGAGAFLAADRRHPGVEQIAEIFPARGRLEAGDSKVGRDPVSGGACRHRPGDAAQSARIGGRDLGIRRKHGERI